MSNVRKVVAVGLMTCGLPVAALASHTYQTANVGTFAGGAPTGGAASLYRTADALTASISMTALDKKAAYTVWAVVWNNPAACVGGCGEDDLGIAGNSIYYAGGFVTGTDGTATVDIHLDTGHLPAGVDVLIPGGITAGNGHGVEVHFVIRSHGKVIPALASTQISTFNGACDLNACTDQFAVAFPPR